MADIDTDLAASLRQAMKKPMFFVFIAKGTDGKLLVDKKKIPTPVAAEAKKECGGGVVFRGRCNGDEGTLIFEVAKEPPATLAVLIKKIIKRDSGLTMKAVEVRVASDLADESEGTEGQDEQATESVDAPTPTSTAPTSQEPALVKRLNAASAGIKAALKGPNAARVQTLFVAVNGHIKAKDFEQASASLDQLEALLNPPAPVVEAKPVSNVVFTQSRLLWDSTRKSVQVELQGMEKKLLAHCQAVNNDANAEFEYDLNEAATNVKQLYSILSRLDERLMDKLDEALNAATPDVRKAKQLEAKAISEDYRAFVTSDPLLTAMAASTIAPSKIQQTILNVLNGLASKL